MWGGGGLLAPATWKRAHRRQPALQGPMRWKGPAATDDHGARWGEVEWRAALASDARPDAIWAQGASEVWPGDGAKEVLMAGEVRPDRVEDPVVAHQAITMRSDAGRGGQHRWLRQGLTPIGPDGW